MNARIRGPGMGSGVVRVRAEKDVQIHHNYWVWEQFSMLNRHIFYPVDQLMDELRWLGTHIGWAALSLEFEDGSRVPALMLL